MMATMILQDYSSGIVGGRWKASINCQAITCLWRWQLSVNGDVEGFNSVGVSGNGNRYWIHHNTLPQTNIVVLGNSADSRMDGTPYFGWEISMFLASLAWCRSVSVKLWQLQKLCAWMWHNTYLDTIILNTVVAYSMPWTKALSSDQEERCGKYTNACLNMRICGSKQRRRQLSSISSPICKCFCLLICMWHWIRLLPILDRENVFRTV